MTKRDKLAEGWVKLAVMLRPGTMTDEAAKIGFEMVVKHFKDIQLSSQDVDNLIDHLINMHSFFPTVSEVLEAWETVKPYRTSSEERIDPASLPENERPLVA